MSRDERFARVAAVFKSASALAPDERTAYVHESCADDPDLAREVLELLAADGASERFLEEPAVEWDPETADIEPGTPDVQMIGPYRIIRVIGQGGMGCVYEARQQNPRRIVALKVMRRGISSRSALRRFEYESQLLARLRHPGIAQVLEAGTHDDGTGGVPYFAMEYIPNARIVTAFAEERGLSTEDRLRLFASVCDAVHHGHQRAIIHRDLKPANILVDSSGQPRIIDFGVARATDSDLAVTTHQTDVGQLIGTLQYMSPEQCDADPHDLDTRSDVYSLGVVLYELLTGRLPYAVGKTVVEATRVIREQAPTRPSTIESRLVGDVETIVLKALEKDRTRRYQSAAALADDLRRFLAGEPIDARPPSLTYHARMFGRRHRAAVIAAGAACTTLLLATIVSAVFAIQALRAERRAEQRHTDALVAQQAEAEQRQLAERRFEDVRHLANTFIFDLDERLRKLSGSTASRAFLVSTAMEYLDSLVDESADDPSLRRELAGAYTRIGDIQGHPVAPSLGEMDAARSSHGRAVHLLEELCTAHPNEPEYAVRLAGVLSKIGAIDQYLGNGSDAIGRFESSIEITSAVHRVHPLNAAAIQTLASTLGSVGNLLLLQGDFDGALSYYERALETAEKGVAIDPYPLRARRRLSVSCIEIGAALHRLGRIDEAEPFFQRATEIREALIAADPDDARAYRDLASAHSRLGTVALIRGDYETALDYYEGSLATYEGQLAMDPADRGLMRRTAVLLEKTGNALKQLERLDEAHDVFNRCVDVRRRLVAEEPIPYDQSGLAIGIEHLADVERELGESETAISLYLEAIEIAGSARGSDFSLSIAVTVNAMTAHKLATLHEERAEWADARQWYEAALALMRGADEAGQSLQATPDSVEGIEASIERCRAASMSRSPAPQ